MKSIFLIDRIAFHVLEEWVFFSFFHQNRKHNLQMRNKWILQANFQDERFERAVLNFLSEMITKKEISNVFCLLNIWHLFFSFLSFATSPHHHSSEFPFTLFFCFILSLSSPTKQNLFFEKNWNPRVECGFQTPNLFIRFRSKTEN